MERWEEQKERDGGKRETGGRGKDNAKEAKESKMEEARGEMIPSL